LTPLNAEFNLKFMEAFAAMNNFWSILFDRLTWTLAWHSLLIAVATILLTLPLAFIVAVLLSRTNLLGRIGIRSLLTIWLLSPVYVFIAGWRDLFGPQGWIPAELFEFNLLDGWIGTVFLHSVAVFPWTVLILSMGSNRVSSALEDDAALNTSYLEALFRVALAKRSRMLVVAAAWIILTVFGEMSIASVCNVRTFSEVIFTGIPLGQGLQSGVEIIPGGVVCLLTVAVGTWLAVRLSPDAWELTSRNDRRVELKRWRFVVSAGVWCLALVALAPCVIGLGYKAGETVTESNGDFVRGWSLFKSIQITANSPIAYFEELAWTGVLSLAVAAATCILALMFSAFATRSSLGKLLSIVLLAMLFAIPQPIVGIVLAWTFNQSWFTWAASIIDRTIFVPWLAVLTVTLPLITYLFWHGLHSFRQLTEMAQLDGGSALRIWFHIILPGNWRLIIAGGIAAGVVAANDIAASILVLPAGIDTISRRIFGLLHFGGEDNVAGIILFNWLVIAVASLIIQRLIARQQNPMATHSHQIPGN